MTAAAVRAEIAALGIRVWVDGELIRFRPKSAMPPELADRVRRCKLELIALLRSETRPNHIVLDARPCEVVWMDALAVAAPPRADCACCRTRRWWRLRGDPSPGRPWTCGTCHPPIPSGDEIEWAEVRP